MREKPKADLLVCHAGQLVTVAGNSAVPKRGQEMSRIGVIKDGAVAAADGTIVAVGTTAEVMAQVETCPETRIVDAAGRLVLPGLVDPHTHLVFAGSRENEFELKIKGMSYLDILRQGGGILRTVRETRAASRKDLFAIGRRHLDQMLNQGTTTAEVKSGYGLNVEDEIKTLHVIRDLHLFHPMDLVPTFLGAHAIPEEYQGCPDAFLELVIDKMLPAVAREKLAEFCDVFCEEGVFSIEQSRRVLAAAQELGLKAKIHADEIVSLGGGELAAEMKAVSADHLVAVSDRGIARMAEQGTIAVLLPATTFCLMGKQYAPARKMIEAGLPVALASDFNPGSSPVNSLPVVMGIACRQLKMSPAEVITAVTINAAHAIGRAAEVGSIEVGKKADLVVFAAPSFAYLPYRFGTNLVETVIKDGRVVVEN